MAVIVSDTSPVRALAHLGHLVWLPELFQEVFVPPAVAAELLHPPAGLNSVAVDDHPFLTVKAPVNAQRVSELKGIVGCRRGRSNRFGRGSSGGYRFDRRIGRAQRGPAMWSFRPWNSRNSVAGQAEGTLHRVATTAGSTSGRNQFLHISRSPPGNLEPRRRMSGVGTGQKSPAANGDQTHDGRNDPRDQLFGFRHGRVTSKGRQIGHRDRSRIDSALIIRLADPASRESDLPIIDSFRMHAGKVQRRSRPCR